MTQSATRWVAERLKEAPGIIEVEIVAPQILLVKREKYSPFYAGVVAVEVVDARSVEDVLNGHFTPALVINLPKESIWTGVAIEMVQAAGAAFGGMKELYSAISAESPNLIENRDFAFVERGLRQHNAVTGFTRVYDRKYTVSRKRGEDLSVVFLNEYELTADDVRTARDRYGAFDILVRSNPNGGSTNSAKRVAESLGIEVHDWSEFYSRLHIS